jgi:WD40-like Beta Propeller Repeat
LIPNKIFIEKMEQIMIRKSNLALIFLSVLFMVSAVYSQQTAEYKVGITYGNSLMSKTDKFEFQLGRTEKITLDWSNRVVNFAAKFRKGQSYNVTQISGARTCSISNNQGVITNQDVLISVSCGFPPLSIFKLNVIGIEQGETFSFADEYGRSYTYPFSVTANLGGFPIGDSYNFTQTNGTRQCKMTNNQGVAPSTPLTIQADCRKNIVSPNPTPPDSVGFDLVSRSADNKNFGTFYDSNSPDIGGIGEDEGRYVTFVSSAAGLGNSTGKYRQIIWRDRKTGETRVVSQGMNGAESNQNSFAPAISADGKSVAFESYSTNLVPIDTNKVRDVFVWNYDRNTVSSVSDAPGGIEANSEAFEPTISGDGRFIAFSSSASTLTTGVDGTSTVNLFLKDMQTGTVTLISRDPKTQKGGGGSRPSISEDGNRIAFYNYFPLTSDDKNTLWDIYVWQRGNPKLKRVSLTSEHTERDQGTESSSRVITPTISGDGRFVTFATTAKNMFSSDTNGLQDAFRVEIDTGIVTPLSFANGSFGDGDSPVGQGEKIPITFDGSKTIFTSKSGNLGGSLIMQNLIEGSNLRVITPKKSADGVEFGIGVPAISGSGKCVAFGSNIKLDKRFPSSGIFVSCSGN